MVNTLEKPAQWQSEFFVAWVGEAGHEAALAQPNEWWGPIAETLKAQGHYAQVSLLCGGDVQRTEQYREWLLAQTTYPVLLQLVSLNLVPEIGIEPTTYALQRSALRPSER